MGQKTQVRTTFLRSLLHDRTASTIAISAAALIPILAMVGGGIDASRYYMAASRMQAACDAGALAARRSMIDDTFRPEDEQVGLNFFDQNFNDGMFGSEARVRSYTSDGEGVVNGTATGTLPTTIMAAFGYDELNISVNCSAEINISNSDIMFVLDVTGSMAGAKIIGLRSAVMSFYDTVEAATSDSAQVRYGFVPYSMQANVGFLIPTEYMATSHTYQSRVARFREEFTFIPGNGIEPGDEIVISDQDEWLPRDISNFGSGNNNDYRFFNKNNKPKKQDDADYDRCNAMSGITHSVGGESWEILTDEYRLKVWSGGDKSKRAGCRGRVRKTRIATAADVIEDQNIRNVVWQDYLYCPVDTADATPCDVSNPADSPAGWETVNLSTLYDDNQIMLPTGTRGAMVNHIWDGCVEEAATVSTDIYDPLPNGAFDLNINLVPATEAQRWKPALRNAVWKRENPGNTLGWLAQTTDEARPAYTCPAAARRLAEITRGDLQTYVNSLLPTGRTYHDIGMIWGARFISPRGIFAADNATAPNGDAIARHIVFMTDGAQVNNVEDYSTQGIEWWDRRISGDGNATRAFNRRAARLQAACRAARQENVTVWVVAFGTALTQNLIDCASPGRAFEASDSATLNARFQEIAQKIAALRLTE